MDNIEHFSDKVHRSIIYIIQNIYIYIYLYKIYIYILYIYIYIYIYRCNIVIYIIILLRKTAEGKTKNLAAVKLY